MSTFKRRAETHGVYLHPNKTFHTEIFSNYTNKFMNFIYVNRLVVSNILINGMPHIKISFCL